ncbi:MAG: PEP-CTERM sorting domain-containing protein [Salinisphaera sp.]|uniref:PEP-CTERM sorting domain-containing protein n=1 Tax=Salinisphaera sp. TaxID=1914330 RepID=UPI003C7C4811
MNIFKLGALAFLVLASASASATMITSSYTVHANSSDPGLVIQTQDHSANPFSYDLNVGQSKTFGLFDIWTNENSLDTYWFSCGADCNPLPISVAFGFTSPVGGQGTINGETYGTFTGFLNEEGVVQWDNPLNFAFGPNGDGLIQVSLSDETFNKGFLGLDNGPCDGATVEATLKYVSADPSADVPEPGTFGLFGLALAGIAFAAYRRRSLTL